MAIQGIEWILVVLFFIIVIVSPIIIIRRRRRSKRLEHLIISFARSKGGASLDDLILATGLSVDEVTNIVQRLVSSNVLKIAEKENKTIYTLA